MPDQTPTWQLPYPLAGDPPAGHLQIQALAERLDQILTDERGAREAPAAPLAVRSNPATDVTSGGPVGNDLGWLTQQSFSTTSQPVVPDSGDVQIVVLVTGSVTTTGSSVTGRRVARTRIDFDPAGSGSWGSGAILNVEVNGPEQRSAAIAHQHALTVPVAQALSCRWRVVAIQATLGSPGDLLFREGRVTATMVAA